jgi:hypothetical protein
MAHSRGPTKLEHQAAVEIEPNNIRFRFTRLGADDVGPATLNLAKCRTGKKSSRAPPEERSKIVDELDRGLIDFAGLILRRTGGQPIMIPKRLHPLWRALWAISITDAIELALRRLDRELQELRAAHAA